VASSLVWALPDRTHAGRVPRVVPPVSRDTAAVTDRRDAGDAGGPALADLDEAGLIAACVSGRPGAFDLIVERHRRPVYQLCYRFVGNHEDASDLTQDVFLRAYRGLGAFRGGSSLATWLYRIGVNLCLNRVGRKTSPTESLDVRQHIDSRTESASDRVLREERSIQVRKAIAALPPKQRATLVLRMYHELSHEEIAGVLGSSVGAVKANFFHALGNLKKRLRQEEQ
jgi:RNA polymerase sigma-70 factor, ECF subfamily